MAKIKGICKNIDGCDLAADKVIQEADSFDFKCSECGKELTPLEDKKKKKRKGFPIPTIIAGVVILLAIIVSIFVFSGDPKVEKLTLDKDQVSLKPDQTESVVATVEPLGVKPELVWKSSDEAVISVNDGVITAKAVGKATVSVAVKGSENVFATCECIVIEEDVDMETLDIQEDPLTLRPGGHQQLTVKFTPEDQNETISWTSSDESIAMVSPRGKVEAVKVGQVLIIAKSDRTGVSDTAKVSVDGPAEMPENQTTETKAPTPPTPKPATSSSKPAASGSKDLGYATFKGTWPNDVNGRMVFKTSHVIDSKDPKKRMAEAGDYVIGEWSEGHLVQGIWYGSNNQVKGSVILGK